jgi:hypothetical protein
MLPEGSARAWRKSSRSGGEGGNCVEVARFDTGIGVRDSKDPAGGVLRFTGTAWTIFLADLGADGAPPG